MKKKIVLLICFVAVLCLAFASCSKGYDAEIYPSYEKDGYYNGSESINNSDANLNPAQEELAAPNRKIIYSANITMSDKNFSERIAVIRGALKADEWLDSESVESDYAYFTARVKSTRLDEFLAQISNGAEVGTMQKEARDISLSYQSKEDRIAALTEEKNMLTTYIDNGAISAEYGLTRLAEINTEIKRLNGELASYDSLIEYSTVTIRLSKTETPEADPTYSQRASSTLSDTWQALGDFFKFLGLVIIALLPWQLIIIPVCLIIVFSVLYAKRKGPFKNRPEKTKAQPIAEVKTEEKINEEEKEK